MLKVLLLLGIWASFSSAYTVLLPELPRVQFNPTRPSQFNNTFYVSNSSALSAALISAQPGDRIVLKAGVNYTTGSTFDLPIKANPNSLWIVITTSDEDLLPPRGSRVSPQDSIHMPIIRSSNVEPALRADSGVKFWWLTGIEVSLTANALGDINKGGTYTNNGLIRLNTGSSYFVIDRCYIHGNSYSNSRRGLMLNSGYTEISDSYFADWHSNGQDAQAINGWNGPGPYRIYNNFLSGSGENVMFGGAPASGVNGIASDIEIVNNHFFKPLSWNKNHPSYGGYNWVIKNLLEFKCGNRVLVEGNILENNWLDAQTGTAINVKVSVFNNDTFYSTSHLTFRHNIIRNSGSGIVCGNGDQPYNRPNHILLFNNLFYDLNNSYFPGDGDWIRAYGSKNVTVNHNTCIRNTRGYIASEGASGWNITNNLGQYNQYALKASGIPEGKASLVNLIPWNWQQNGMSNKNISLSTYPNGTIFAYDAKFEDAASNLLKLLPSSPFYQKGTDGKDLGIDWDLLMAHVMGVLEGTPGTSSGLTPNELYSPRSIPLSENPPGPTSQSPSLSPDSASALSEGTIVNSQHHLIELIIYAAVLLFLF